MSKSAASWPGIRFGDRFAGARDCKWHLHDVAELVLVTEGDCSCTVGTVTLPGGPGMLWVMPAHTPQYQENVTFTRTVYLGIVAGGAGASGFDERPRGVQVGADGYVRRWMEDLVDLQQSGAEAREVIGPLTAALLGEVSRQELHREAVARYHPAVRAALGILERKLTQALRVEDLAEEVHVSASHLTALFRAAVGVPPLQYQKRARLRQAERLLRNPHVTIKEVARACGYEDCSYFVRLFRQRYGMSPQR
ncbi:MAG: AraC family transcriptional regulator, partial [Phycisphaerae bacterium]